MKCDDRNEEKRVGNDVGFEREMKSNFTSQLSDVSQITVTSSVNGIWKFIKN